MQAFREANEFVDYYALLEAPATATDAVLRKRIFELYEEARHNLEHRNHRKRFYYTTLYETHLARARHFLLDAERRPRYDACLRAYQAGKPFDFAALFESGGKSAPPSDPPAPAQALPQPQSQPLATPQPAASVPAVSTPAAAPARPSAPVTPIQAPAAPVLAPVAAQVPAAAQVSAKSAQVAPAPVPSPGLEKLLAPPTLQISTEEDPRRRDFRRREMIGIELRNRSRIVGLSAAAVFVICGTATLYPLQNFLVASHKSADSNLTATDMFVEIAAFLLICAVAMWVSWQSARYTRRHIIGSLSRLSYDQLLRQCKH